MKKRKSEMERGWKGTCDTVMKTQRDMAFMAKHSNHQWSILANSFSQEHIKVVENYQSQSQTYPHQLSQSQLQSQSSENFLYTPMKDSALDSKSS